MINEETADLDVEPLSGESPMDWLARIAPEEWDVAEDGYALVLQSSDRRVVVDPLANRTVWQERIETGDDVFGERWIQREVTEGRWHMQTTAGLLLWGVGDFHGESEIPETTETLESEERNGEVR
jgi:hypothetical protein